MGLVNRVSPGQKVSRSAAVENALRAAAESFLLTGGGAASDRGLQARSTGIIRIKNTTDGDLPRFAIVGIDAPLVTPTDSVSKFKSAVSFKGVVPAEATHEGLWAVLLQPLAKGGLGSALASGIVQVQISGPIGPFAEISDGVSDYLTPGDSGSARILWPSQDDEDTDQRWAVIRIGEGGGGSNGSVPVISSTRILTTYCCEGNLADIAIDGTVTAGTAIYLVQRTKVSGAESVYQLSSGNLFLGNQVGFGDPASFGEDRPVYVVVPTLSYSSGSPGGVTVHHGNDTYTGIDDFTFGAGFIVSNANDAVTINIGNGTVDLTCSNDSWTGNITFDGG